MKFHWMVLKYLAVLLSLVNRMGEAELADSYPNCGWTKPATVFQDVALDDKVQQCI